MSETIRAEGIPLFPQAEPVGRTPEGKPTWDVTMRCSCPDWARPCKHMAAVLLLLGEEMARRPVTLLALRGVDVEALVPPDAPEEPPVPASSGWPVSSGWPEKSAWPEKSGWRASAPANGGAHLVRRLGAVPYWRGAARCVEALEKMQTRAGAVAREAAAGNSIDLRG